MIFALSISTLLTGLAVFGARILDVSLGTMRTITIVQGRLKTSFILAFFEVAIWLAIISVVLAKVQKAPVVGIFYALGYATGTVVGIAIEKKMALGQIVIRTMVAARGEETARALRDAGFGVTTFFGYGMNGVVTEILVAGLRKEAKQILSIIKKFEPNPFYILEQTGSISKIDRPPANAFLNCLSLLKGK